MSGMRGRPWPRCSLAILCILALCAAHSRGEIAPGACEANSPAALNAAREQVREMFYHGYNSYKAHALPADELRPLTCDGEDTFGGLAVTLIDTLDMLAVLGDWEEFVWAARRVQDIVVDFDIPANVSVFESNIRVLGGLLSAHGLLTDAAEAAGWQPKEMYPEYDGGLLRLAVDLADRLMPAFKTPTGIPFGAVNLQAGVWHSETVIASTAGAGGLLVEFGTLSVMSGDPKYYRAAFRALEALHKRTAWTGLVGNHIDITDGQWVAQESGIGALIDSYYEYMVKGYVLFGDTRLMNMFWDAYRAVQRYIRHGPWYLPADMFSGQVSSPSHCSLGAFWPGMQVLLGDVGDALETTRAHYSVWRRYGCIPEGYNVLARVPGMGTVNYPLRPELIESVFMLHWSTNDSSWVGVARAVMHSLNTLTRVDCGFARIEHVGTHVKENIQDSFLLSETLKYLYLTFDTSNWFRSGRFVLSTEAHPVYISGNEVPGVPRDVYVSGKHKRSGDSSDMSFRKCPRRSPGSQRSSCGYGMRGTDFPNLRMSDLQPEPVADDVRAMVRERIAVGGLPLRIGEVFFGAEKSYRVVRSGHNEVSLASLDPVETETARREMFEFKLAEVHSRAMRKTVSEVAGFESRSPNIPFPQLLAASSVWHSLDMCEALDKQAGFSLA